LLHLILRAGVATVLMLAASLSAAQPAFKVKDVFEVGPAVYVRALTIERAQNTLWVGTSAGVHEVALGSGQLRRTFTRKEGLANEYVFAVGIDKQGYKWFGTNSGGVSRYKDGKWKTFFPMHGLADYWVYAFDSQKDGTLWIGTWAGANRYDLASGKFTTYVKELVNEWVYGIAVDARDRVWFGTEGGVSMLDGKTWTSWTHKDGLGAPNVDNLPFSTNTGLGTRSRHDLSVGAEGKATYNPNYVFAMLSAADGAIWAGTWGGGAARFDGKAWRNYTAKDGLAANIVYAIVQAPDGALWFGTSNGVSRWDGKQWTTLREADGLPGPHVYAIATAANGDVWVGTRKGVARIAR
jgi:ligand-binding sensor domain-containing protein